MDTNGTNQERVETPSQPPTTSRPSGFDLALGAKSDPPGTPGEHGAEESNAEDRVAGTLMQWGGAGAVAGLVAGGSYFGSVGGAFVGGTALAAIAIAASTVFIAARPRAT
jgi:hypothetical protein